MTNLQEELAILRAHNRVVHERNPRLAAEARVGRRSRTRSSSMRRERPALAIKDNVAQLAVMTRSTARYGASHSRHADHRVHVSALPV
jgi:hypothetical protein